MLARFLLPAIFAGAVIAASVPSVKIDDVNKRMQNGNDTIYVVNFWATWCAPCVAELPYFEQLDSAYKYKNVKVILVSTDFRKDMNTRLLPFLEKKKYHSEVNFLDEIYDNEWIPKVDSSWQGNIPATKIYNSKTGKSVFLPRETSYHELDSLISALR
jgi:thiol-disulfide isomerase/thioredoxin